MNTSYYRETVKDAILDLFAGPPENGIYSPSVQHSLHLMEKRVLDSIPEVYFNILI